MCENMGKIEKNIDTSLLPRKNRKTKNDDFVIDWKKSVEYSVDFLYGNIHGKLEIIDYISKSRIIYVKYNDNTYETTISSLLNCNLGKILNIYTKDFKINIGENLIDDKRNIVITDRKYIKNKNGNTYKFYKYKCQKCGFDCGKHYSLVNNEYKDELWTGESSLLDGCGCSCCNSSPGIVVEGINDIFTTAPWMIPIINDDEFCKTHTKHSNIKIYPRCPDCGRIKNRKLSIGDIYDRHSIGCSCGDGRSKISKYIYNILEQIKRTNQIVDFETEKQFDWCSFYNPFIKKMSFGRYDFLIPQKNILLEADGGFHRQDNTLNKKTLEESKFTDEFKDKLAIKNGYSIIRISDEGDFKENVLCSKLNDIFDLKVIDWNEALEFSTNNLVKLACQYKKNNSELTAKDIGDIMKYDRTSIIKWLKLGTKLGWCYYDSKEEMKMSHSKNGDRNRKRCSKPVEVFKEGKSLGIFQSCCELERKSEEFIGIKLCNSSISSVANGNKKSYKGFTFVYV